MNQFYRVQIEENDDSWRADAKCARPEYRDLEWFPEDPGEEPEDRRLRHLRRKEMRSARRRVVDVCNSCPVQAECHAFAERARVTSGIWAGKKYGSKSWVDLEDA